MAKNIDKMKKDIVGDFFSQTELENYMYKYDFVLIESDEYDDMENIIKFTNFWIKY